LCRRTAASRSTIVNAGLLATRHLGKAPGTGIHRLLPIGIKRGTQCAIFAAFAQWFVHIVHSWSATMDTRRGGRTAVTMRR